MEQNNHLPSLLKQYSEKIGIQLDDEQIKQFMIYLEQLRIWNQSVNLTNIIENKEIIVKHFVDSLAGLMAEKIGPGARMLDVGTGAGFPGIPLRIARKDLDVTLVEPAKNKASFLHSIVGLLRLERVKIFHGTLERFTIEKTSEPKFDYITTRALKYNFILRKSSQLLLPDGKVILYLSQKIEQSELDGKWVVINECEFDLPEGLGKRVICVLGLAG